MTRDEKKQGVLDGFIDNDPDANYLANYVWQKAVNEDGKRLHETVSGTGYDSEAFGMLIDSKVDSKAALLACVNAFKNLIMLSIFFDTLAVNNTKKLHLTARPDLILDLCYIAPYRLFSKVDTCLVVLSFRRFNASNPAGQSIGFSLVDNEELFDIDSFDNLQFKVTTGASGTHMEVLFDSITIKDLTIAKLGLEK